MSEFEVKGRRFRVGQLVTTGMGLGVVRGPARALLGADWVEVEVAGKPHYFLPEYVHEGKRGRIYRVGLDVVARCLRDHASILDVLFHPRLPFDAVLDSIQTEERAVLVKMFHPDFELVEEGAPYPVIDLTTEQQGAVP